MHDQNKTKPRNENKNNEKTNTPQKTKTNGTPNNRCILKEKALALHQKRMGIHLYVVS